MEHCLATVRAWSHHALTVCVYVTSTADFMKGPGGRSKFVIGRTWECPVCGRRERTGGDVVNRTCTCVSPDDPHKHPWMRLIDDPPSRRPLRYGKQPPLSEPGDASGS
jgi:hypothetical protein